MDTAYGYGSFPTPKNKPVFFISFNKKPSILGTFHDIQPVIFWLVVFNPSEKYARQNGFIFPKDRGENSKHI